MVASVVAIKINVDHVCIIGMVDGHSQILKAHSSSLNEPSPTLLESCLVL